MKIYDCFMFFNELDLLDIRLHELNETVDKFVLVESHYCHNGSPKPLYYGDNKSRFAEFNSKIIHIVADDIVPPKNLDWLPKQFCTEVECNQRSRIEQGIADASPIDFILVSDVDEIPRAAEVAKLKKGLLKSARQSVCFVMDIYYYYLNNQMLNSGWSGTVGMAAFQRWGPQEMRDTRMNETKFMKSRIRVEHAGWHFSYMGEPENIKEKLEVSADTTGQEYTEKWIEEIMNAGGDIRKKIRSDKKAFGVQDISTMPAYIQQNKEKFAHLLKGV